MKYKTLIFLINFVLLLIVLIIYLIVRYNRPKDKEKPVSPQITNLRVLLFIILILGVFFSLVLIFSFLFPEFNYPCEYYNIYREVVYEFLNGELIYDNVSFIYFPNFFLLFPFYLTDYINVIFLLTCLIISFILLLKITSNIYISFVFISYELVSSLSANNDTFILMGVLFCCLYYKNDTITSILLAFISSKATVLIVVVYFFFISKHKLKFLVLFCLTFGLFNLYFLFRPEEFFLLFRFEGHLYAFDPQIHTFYAKSYIFFIIYFGYKKYNESLVYTTLGK